MFEHFLFAGGIAALIVWVLPYLFPPLDSQAVTAEGFEIPVEPEEDARPGPISCSSRKAARPRRRTRILARPRSKR